MTANAVAADGIPDGYMTIEGDIIVPEDFYETQGKQAWRENSWWPGGIVPYEFDTNVVSWQQDSMLAAMGVWENIAGVDFVPVTDEFNHVHIQASSSVNNSQVGMTGLGEQIINIVSWNRRITIVHELMHCLGFWHEQSRPARDLFVTIQIDSVQEGKEHNFDIHGDAGEWGYYDFTSLMHYGDCDFSICECGAEPPCCCEPTGEGRTIVVKPEYSQYQSVIGQRDSVSYLDSLSMMFAYPPEPWWKFVSRDADGLFPDGTFGNPYHTFTDGVAGTIPGGVLWILAPGAYSAQGLHKKPIILTAPLGGVVLSN
ncbi:MAG: M12 family metallopeptidase [bacterium]